jgi:hypothetical protein
MSGRRSATIKPASASKRRAGGGDDDDRGGGGGGSSAAAGAGGGEGPNEFIQFLLRCLAEYPHLVAWRPEGGLVFRSLEDRFQPVLASAGYSTKIATFVRNLNYHSFSKIKSDDETLSVFKHALFVQGRMGAWVWGRAGQNAHRDRAAARLAIRLAAPATPGTEVTLAVCVTHPSPSSPALLCTHTQTSSR